MTTSDATPTPVGSRRPGGWVPRVLLAAIWLGLAIGLAELVVLGVLQQWNSALTIGSLRLNRHYPWMIPLSNALIFAVCGLLLEVVVRLTPPKVGIRLASFLLTTLSVLAILLMFRQLAGVACVLLAVGIAARAGKSINPRLDRLGRFSLRTLPILALIVAALCVGRYAQFAAKDRRAANRPVAAKGSPNVLFLVLDTVRARSLSVYGYGRKTSPRLEQLAAQGVRFANARSTAPWTLPSHASMFTGLWPHQMFRYADQPLGSQFPTLAGRLTDRGYATGGFVANTYYCNAGFGLSQGFDHYEDFYEVQNASGGEILRNSELGRRILALSGDEESLRPDGRKDADRISQDFLRWSETRGDRPFFAFLNYFDAHVPYSVPDHGGDVCHFGLVPKDAHDAHVLTTWQKRTDQKADPQEVALARDAYDDCLAYLDGALGRLFDEMGRRKMLDNTLIVVTADHGEQIGEHGLYGHGRSLYREELHVPLLVVQPGRTPAGKVVAQPVSLRDLPATVLDLIGVPNHDPALPGSSLLATWDSAAPARPATADLVLSEVNIRDKVSGNPDRVPALRGPMYSIISNGQVYIRSAGDQEELFDLEADPGEEHNLIGNAPTAVAQLRDRLRDLTGVPRPAEAIAVKTPAK